MKLRDYLELNNITQQDAADALGIKQPHLANILAGQRGCSLALALRIIQWSNDAVTIADLSSDDSCPDCAGAL